MNSYAEKLKGGTMFITKYAKCKIELQLLKDSTEGMNIYCGKCYDEVKKDKK